MEDLHASMKVAFSNTFMMYFKAHTFHWNVEGILFPVYHNFFGDIYQEVYGSIDTFAEQIRALGIYAPFSLSSVIDNSTCECGDYQTSDYAVMVDVLYGMNEQVIESLNHSISLAEAYQNHGLVDFLGCRIGAHQKMEWMLRSVLS